MDNLLFGRGVKIWRDGVVHVGYFEHGEASTGHGIYIQPLGRFQVGERTRELKGSIEWKYTSYTSDGIIRIADSIIAKAMYHIMNARSQLGVVNFSFEESDDVSAEEEIMLVNYLK